jgi:quinol-cytochrome oxidoreductase complex cytochrome b subunit
MSTAAVISLAALQTVAAVIEAGAGLALLGLPSFTAALLLGTPLESAAAVSLARVGGAAIVALAIVCWLARRDVRSPASQGVVAALLFYNLVVAGVLAFAGFGHDLHGILLWPAVVFHIAMAVWCVATFLRSEERILR